MTTAYALDRLRDSGARHIPLLYLPPGLLRKAVLKSDILQKLTVKGPRDKPLSVIRDWAYFVVRATMRPANTAIGEPPVTTIKELRALRDQLVTIDTTRQRLSEILITLNIGDNEVTERVDTLFDLCFYTNVWRAYQSGVQQEDGVYAEADAVKENVNNALRQVRSTLIKNVEEYSRLGDLWQKVLDAAKSLREHFRSRGVVYVRACGAFRFAAPPKISEEAQRLLDEIVFSTGAADTARSVGAAPESSSVSKIILLYERAKSSSLQDQAEIGALAIVLWCLGLDTELLKAVAPSQSADWLSILRAASELRTPSKPRVAEDALIRLERAFNDRASSDEERGRVAIAIGYLSFHIALRKGYEPFWLKTPPQRTITEKPMNLIVDAARYANRAVSITPDPVLHTYAVNQSLYYLVASGTGLRPELRDLADQLLRFKGDPERWDYRYDDTIARYFMWASLTTPDHRLKLELADSAKQHIDEAFEAGHGDSEVALFRSILENYRDELMNGARPPSQSLPTV
jgi:hypothetical protein